MSIILKRNSRLDDAIRVESLRGVTFTNENGGHRFVISCFREEEHESLTGTISVRFMRSDGVTILLGQGAESGRENFAGIDEEGNAFAILHQDCYNVPGRFQIAVFNTADGSTTCIYAAVGMVQRTQGEALIDSGDIIGSVDDLIAEIQRVEQTIPADYSTLSNGVVRHDIVQNLTSAQKTQARTNINSASVVDLDDLKSALDDVEKINLMPLHSRERTGWIGSSGKWVGVGGVTAAHATILANGGTPFKISMPSGVQGYYGALKTYNIPANGETADFSEQTDWTTRRMVPAGGTVERNLPSDANYLYVALKSSGNSITPSEVVVDKYNFTTDSGLKVIDSKYEDVFTGIGNEVKERENKDREIGLLPLKNRESSGVANSSGKWAGVDGTTAAHAVIKIVPNDEVVISMPSGVQGYYGALKTYNTPENNETVDFSTQTGWTGRILIVAGGRIKVTMPSDAKFLYIALKTNNNDISPASCSVNGYEFVTDGTGLDVISSKYKYYEFPSYYFPAIEAVLPTIQSHNILASHGDSLMFITDSHFNNSNETASFGNKGYSLSLAEYMSKRTNNNILVFGGDLLTENHAKSEAIEITRKFYQEAYNRFGRNFRTMRGNHDLNISESSSNLLSLSELYAISMKKIENTVNTNGGFYYYWDNVSQKIRYIVIDFGMDASYSKANMIWLYNVMMECDTGWNIVLFAHGVANQITDENTYHLIGNSHVPLDFMVANNARNSTTAYSTIFDFSNAKGTARIVIAGHVHRDEVIYYNNFPIVFCRKDGFTESGSKKGTYQESEVTFIDIDLDNSKAYFTNLGDANNTTRTFDLADLVT